MSLTAEELATLTPAQAQRYHANQRALAEYGPYPLSTGGYIFLLFLACCLYLAKAAWFLTKVAAVCGVAYVVIRAAVHSH